jgi:hypothetical protein
MRSIMKRLFNATLALAAIAVVAPSPALTEPHSKSYLNPHNKGIVMEVSLSDRQRNELMDGLNRLTERLNDERDTTLNR